MYTFAQANGGRLPESLMVPVILQPTMSALNYIHSLVRAWGGGVRPVVGSRALLPRLGVGIAPQQRGASTAASGPPP